MSSVFRARFVEQVRLCVKQKKITGQVPKNLFDNEWVVYAKQPFGGPRQVISYLGRYTHRTAISNARILEVTDSTVTFAWKDYRNQYARRATKMQGEDFLRLFCQHNLSRFFIGIFG